MFPESPLWDFSLRLYARPGVAEACLALQARHGIDVNLLFCCLWLGTEGRRLGKRDIARLAARVRELQEGVVKPLRTARMVLKRLVASKDDLLRPELAALRSAIKKSELDAEHAEQVMLGVLLLRRDSDAPSRDLAQANAVAYLALIGARLEGEDRTDLERIVAALPRPNGARLNGAARPKPARKQPLARPGQGRTI